MNREELAWAGGLFAGEGCFTTSGTAYKVGGSGHIPKASIGMQDQDVVARFLSAVNMGKVYGPYKGRPKMVYWTVHGFEKVQALTAMLWPWLNERRRTKAISILKGGN